MEQVTPQLEWTPERTYKLEGKRIDCFEVVSCEGVDYELIVNDEPLFSFEMPSVCAATKLMNDMYYGEYTGA